VNVVCWPDQHDARDRLRAIPKRRECRGSNPAGIGIACVRRNQRLGHDFCRRRDIAKQVQNLRPQPIRIIGVEQTCHR
jgi:hypothetical protein